MVSEGYDGLNGFGIGLLGPLDYFFCYLVYMFQLILCVHMAPAPGIASRMPSGACPFRINSNLVLVAGLMQANCFFLFKLT